MTKLEMNGEGVLARVYRSKTTESLGAVWQCAPSKVTVKEEDLRRVIGAMKKMVGLTSSSGSVTVTAPVGSRTHVESAVMDDEEQVG